MVGLPLQEFSLSLTAIHVTSEDKDHDSAYKTVLEMPLESLTHDPHLPVLDIAGSATIGRFRLIDCAQYIRNRVLIVHEFDDFPVEKHPYVAISYVWRGNAVDGCKVGPTFSVAGAEDGDPVGIDVLRHACTAALHEGANYIWLDRLCIMQTSKDDKNWQIGHMFQIYQRSALSLVFPGGIQRLVGLDEPTTWINRGWTLQEALAPLRAEVVYSWTHGSGMYYGRYRGNITELVPGESAKTPLRELLALNGFGATNFFPSASGVHTTFRTTIFGAPNDSSPNVPSEQKTEVVIFMLKSALHHGTRQAFDELAPTIWRSALFRASSRPVDMVFSIMGLFGVTLDIRKFHKDDRLGATVALMREILRQGGRASWLGLAPYLPPHPQLSTIPVFPRTRVEGQVSLELGDQNDNRWSVRIASKQRSAILDVRAISLPTGSIDDEGYLVITRKAIRIYPQPNLLEPGEDHHQHMDSRTVSPPQCCLRLWDISQTGWRFYEDQDDIEQASPRTFAVLLGYYNEFSLDGLWTGPRHLGALLIREHAPDKFHVDSFFELSDRLENWINTWGDRTLHIGGPNAKG
ncbi:hypothetical protein VNI00_008250 [Paramarasmius palmivorus]|uniref:Heterokaryon incompatibility domain-containing protein n=1 Tax=Paramarasmius palmivorus TaxID=297713 RepID=A0AAW0CXT0_9AGAR